MFHLDHDTGILETEAIRRRDNVLAAIGASWRHLRLVLHGTQDAGYQLLHLIPIQPADLVLFLFKSQLLDAGQGVDNIGSDIIILRIVDDRLTAYR